MYSGVYQEVRLGHGSLFQNPTQPKISGPNPQKSSPDPTQPIIDTWYGILDYNENFIQQLLHVTDKFTARSSNERQRSPAFRPHFSSSTVNDSYYSAAVLISRQ